MLTTATYFHIVDWEREREWVRVSERERETVAEWDREGVMKYYWGENTAGEREAITWMCLGSGSK